MKVVIVNGSHRLNGNTYAFSKKASEILSKKHQVSVVNLLEQNIKPCTGCLVCEDGGNCTLVDDFSIKISPMLKNADLIILATPTYFNMPTALMVNFLDRTNELCSFFTDNSKKTLFYLVGQTDLDTISDAYNCLKKYSKIMNMDEICEPLMQIARHKDELSENCYYDIGKI